MSTFFSVRHLQSRPIFIAIHLRPPQSHQVSNSQNRPPSPFYALFTRSYIFTTLIFALLHSDYFPPVAPIGLPAGLSSPFPLRRRLRPRRRQAVAEVPRLRRLCRLCPANGQRCRPFRPVPSARDCSTAAPPTARQSAKAACPAIHLTENV